LSSTINASNTGFGGVITTGDSSGVLQLQTAGTNALYIDGSQNVGIGTTSPANKLEVKGSTANTSIQVTSSATTSSYPGIIVKSGTQSVYTMSQSADDGTAYLYNQASASLAFGTNNIERMRIDSSGNLLLNSTSNTTFSGASGSPKQYIYGGSLGSTLNNTVDTLTLVNTNANTNYLRFYQFRNTAGTDWTTATTRISQITDSTLQSYIDFNPVNGNYGMAFGTGNSAVERMRIDSSGNVLMGTTVVNSTGGFAFNANGGTPDIRIGHPTGTSSGTWYASFLYNASSIGSISQNGTTAVLYNTTSDYRLKNDVTPIENALSTISQLNPVSFTWIDGRKDDGFIAHELQEILPNCVTGEKDAVDKEGNPKYQQMDSSGVIPFLVKAIQEQQTLIVSQSELINNLKARIETLEGAK